MSDGNGPNSTGAGPVNENNSRGRKARPERRKRLFRRDRGAQPPTRRRGVGLAALIALIALLVGLAGAGGAAYLWFVGGPRTQALRGEVHSLRQQVSNQADKLRQHGHALGRIGDLSDTQSKLLQRTQAQSNELSALDQKMGNVQKGLSQLNSLVQGGRQIWLLDEVEELLLMANDRLALREDVPGALRALQIAQHRLGQISDPRLIGVRKRLANEIAALQAVPKLDFQGMALQLSSLAGQVHDLPLKQDLPRNYHSTAGSGTPAQSGQPWWQQLGVSIGNALKGLVEIRRTNEHFQPMLPPREAYFLYQNLDLKLESARMAVLQRDNGVFHNSIQTALKWLQTYYKQSAPGVQAMTRELKQLQQKNLQPKLPDIGGSLAALRHELQVMGGGHRVEFQPAGHGSKAGDAGQ